MLLNASTLYKMIKLNLLWIFSNGIKDFTKPNNSINEINNRFQLKNDLLYISKFDFDDDPFNNNLLPRTEIRLENNKLENEKLYHITFECNIENITNANFFQILNRDKYNNAYPIFQLEKRDNIINSRERFNNKSHRIKRYNYNNKQFYQFDIEFKTGNNGIIKLLINNEEVLNYNSTVLYNSNSWIQFGIYGDENKNSTIIYKYIKIKREDEKKNIFKCFKCYLI